MPTGPRYPRARTGKGTSALQCDEAKLAVGDTNCVATPPCREQIQKLDYL
jgi:hypothetical protein